MVSLLFVQQNEFSVIWERFWPLYIALLNVSTGNITSNTMLCIASSANYYHGTSLGVRSHARSGRVLTTRNYARQNCDFLIEKMRLDLYFALDVSQRFLQVSELTEEVKPTSNSYQ